MKKIVNTAKAEYILEGIGRRQAECSCTVNMLQQEKLLHGQILCRGNSSWTLKLTQRDNCRTIFCLDGRGSKGFYFEPDCSKEYCLCFKGGKNSVLRLYNAPDCITKTCFA